MRSSSISSRRKASPTVTMMSLRDVQASSSTQPTKKYTRPLSAYDIFYEEQRTKILASCLKNDTMTQEEASAICNTNIKDCRFRRRRGAMGRRDIKRKVQAMWRSMPPPKREAYELAEKEHLKHCQEQLQAWRTSQQKDQFHNNKTPKEHEPNLTSSNSSGSLPVMMELSSSCMTSLKLLDVYLSRALSLPNLMVSSSTTIGNKIDNGVVNKSSSIDNGSLDDTTLFSSEPPIMPFSYQSGVTNNNQEDEEAVSLQQNYIDISKIEEEEESRHHHLLSDISTIFDDDDASTKEQDTTSVTTPENMVGIVVDELATKLDEEDLDFICSTFNSNSTIA